MTGSEEHEEIVYHLFKRRLKGYNEKLFLHQVRR